VILWLVEATDYIGKGEQHIAKQLSRVKVPVIPIMNKIDLVKKEDIPRFLEGYSKLLPFADMIPVSALRSRNLDTVRETIFKYLPYGPKYFDDDTVTDQPQRQIAAEMIREKVLRNTHDEVPHAIAVEVDEFKERSNGNIFIRATIFVERESQKGIVIGAKGGLLKKIGQEARQDIENLTGCGVFLDLWVKVQADWRNKSKMLKELGYKEP
jgi:GTP-binding protein Era